MAVTCDDEAVQRLAQLNGRIAEYEATITNLRQRLFAATSVETRARRENVYREFQLFFRSPAGSFNLWPLGVMLVGPLISGGIAFASALAITDSIAVGFLAFAFLGAIIATFLAVLLFVPNSTLLQVLAQESLRRHEEVKGAVRTVRSKLADVERLLRVDSQARDSILESVQYQREQLLQQNWRAMRGSEWEAFLAEAFRLRGGVISATGRSGDQGVDLVVELGGERYAIQTKGYFNSVGNSAVQEAVAGMAHYGCNRCAVVTNSRFTSSAIALAESNRCVLIGEDQIPALVLGQLSI